MAKRAHDASETEHALAQVVPIAAAGLAFALLIGILGALIPASDTGRDMYEWWDRSPAILAATALVLGVGLGLIARSWLTGGRDQAYVHGSAPGPLAALSTLMADTVIAEFAPPSGLCPAEVGLLVDGCAQTRHVTATIIDLAVHGHLRLEERAGQGWVLERVRGAPAPARGFEQKLLALLFDNRDRVQLAHEALYWAVVATEIELDEHAVERGWFAADPAVLRQHRRLWGLALVFIGLVVTAALGLRIGASLVGCALIIVGIALFAAAGVMRSRTALGHRLMLDSLGFRLYLEVAEGQAQRFTEHEDLFGAYLPYAVAFGIAREWAHRFDVAGSVYARAWYVPAAREGLRHVEIAERVSTFSTHH